MKTRVAINKPASLIDRDGKEALCTLLDLSVDGFRARLSHPVNLRELAMLRNGGETYGIEVRWASGLELGGRLY